jgi:hypothetical protein
VRHISAQTSLAIYLYNISTSIHSRAPSLLYLNPRTLALETCREGGRVGGREGGREGRKEHLRDGGDDQCVHAHARVEDFLLGKARIDHVDDPVDGQRRLSDVGGDHAFPGAWRKGREGGREEEMSVLGRGEEGREGRREVPGGGGSKIRDCISDGCAP